MSNYANLPAPTPEGGLNRYLQEIRKFPLLEPEEEYMLAKRWVEQEDTGAAHRLVTSHLRLAAKIAMGYRGYGYKEHYSPGPWRVFVETQDGREVGSISFEVQQDASTDTREFESLQH